MRARAAQVLASKLVDPDYYLARNGDVAASGMDPIEHFAQYWHYPPVRAPNARAEPWIFTLSPLVALGLRAAGRDRADVLDYLRQRINDLSGESRPIQLRLCLAVARFLARRPTPAVTAALGRPLGVARIVSDRPGWIERTPVADETTLTFRDPPILPSSTPGETRRIAVPALWCATIRDAAVFGAAEVMARDHLVVHEPAADPRLRYATRQCNFVTNCYPVQRGKILARLPDAAEQTLERAILLGGRGGENYFHFLIEYLTKGHVIERLPELDGVPLLVSAELYPQEIEALGRVLPGRPVIRRRTGARIDVETLHLPSVMSFVPDDPAIPFWRAAAANPDSLRWLRDRVLAGENDTVRKDTRIYLGRSGGRNIGNAEEVAEVFRRHGFVVLDPARLSFAEQVAMFRSATHIAGPVGAAFANLVFASPGARVMGIISPFAVRFSLFAHLARFAGCTYDVLPGIRPDYRAGMEERGNPISVTHGAFGVDTDYLERALSQFLAPRDG
ncbi:glycosyltransferase family 61 protein [Methylobacterium sp. J-070]|uniref:glycosyltransferase family 61 protein n=1 Tax=Methylobacterium sp. J-070 TaxID=2836650 RepID=UPI001FB91DB8|nr:glycosyltransferase family 61 protein [Methylobacterium sp. J-070]MCJ2054942.1 glycosyltransferase family 61 protein [Methylobacterium sp. J-070]